MPAVTFDVWHTLIYLTPDEEEAYYRGQIDLAVEILRQGETEPGAPARSDGELVRSFEEVFSEAVASGGHGRTVTPAEQILRAAERCRRRVRADRYLDGLAAMVARQPFKAAAGGLELLTGLREDGYRVAVVGNTVGETGGSLRSVLDRLGLARPVEVFVFSDEHPWAKPAPEIFWEALRLLGVPADQAVHVGDAWTDVEGASRAGLCGTILFTGLQRYGAHYQALNIDRAYDPSAARAVVGNLDEVRSIVHRLLPCP